MTAKLIPPGAPEFIDKFHQFRYSVFRSETLPSYGNSGEDVDFEAFVAGAVQAGQPRVTNSGRRLVRQRAGGAGDRSASKRTACVAHHRPTRVRLGGVLYAADGVVLDAAWHRAVGGRARGTVVQAHGINTDMDEGGMFRRLAEGLAGEGFGVLRFSFRGHGRSGGTQRGATIAGEMLDLQAAIEAALQRFDRPLSIVAASFGAVSTCVSLRYLEPDLRSLVLWNPVLDLQRTFVQPSLPWGVENFGPAQQALLASAGFLSIDGTFEMGRVLFEELRYHKPLDGFAGSAGAGGARGPRLCRAL